MSVVKGRTQRLSQINWGVDLVQEIKTLCFVIRNKCNNVISINELFTCLIHFFIKHILNAYHKPNTEGIQKEREREMNLFPALKDASLVKWVRQMNRQF